MPLKIGIVVGEISGDILAANLIESIRNLYPDVEVEGIVGPNLINVGCTQLFSMEELAVMGLVEPLKRLPRLFKIRNWLIRYFTEDPPDIFIGVDAPDFNLGLEKALKEKGVTTTHFVSPSVWAWRQGRIKTIKKACDLMLTLFPFEEKFYLDNNVPVKFVGHPTADKIPEQIDIVSAKQDLKLSLDKTIVALLPGSRASELKCHAPLYLEAAKLLAKMNPNIHFVTSLISKYHMEYFESIKEEIAPDLPITILAEKSYSVMRACDVAIVTSGTATLEVMMHKKPMVVAYKTNFFTYHIVKLLIKVKFISLPNLLKNEKLVEELIQHDATAVKIAGNISSLLEDKDLQQKQIENFALLHKQLKKNAGKNAAIAILDLLGVNYETKKSANSGS